MRVFFSLSLKWHIKSYMNAQLWLPLYSHSTCGAGHGGSVPNVLTLGRAELNLLDVCARASPASFTLQASLRIEKSRPSKPIVGSRNSSRSCRCTEPCLLAIPGLRRQLVRRGFLLVISVRGFDEPGHSCHFEYRNAEITDHAQLAVRSDDALRHIATNSDGDHFIQCLLHHCRIVGMHDLSVV